MAVREMAIAVPEIRFRLAIRPNTWTSIRLEFEALSKVEQYCFDLRWTHAELVGLFAARVRGYVIRQNIGGPPLNSNGAKDSHFIDLVLHSPVMWARKSQPLIGPMITLARSRPRWLIELAREAAVCAVKEGSHQIRWPDVTQQLSSFGQKRILDTVVEFSPQCAEIAEIISSFADQAEEFSTDELMKVISNRVLQAVQPRIAGIPGKVAAIDVAAFLFQIGFLSAKRTLADGYEHLTYMEQPDLLKSRTNRDQGVRWEIHPVFRQALRMRGVDGVEKHRARSDGRSR
jgi:hypothetical protein